MINKRNIKKRAREVILRAAFFFALIILLMPSAQDAWSAPGQIYSGDGSIINPTVPPGGWIYPEGIVGSCLICHNPGTAEMFNSVVPDKTSYLKTGHKNVLRSVQTPPVPLAGPQGTAYSADESGNVFNWTNNTIDILGFCSNSLTMDPGNCAAGGGVWISGTKDLYYILGGWMLEPGPPSALFDGSYSQGTQQTAVMYSCGRCHTTGYKMDLVTNNGRKPESAFAGITWTPVTGGKANFDPDGDGPAVAASWAIDGIQCERCHDATHHMNGGPTVPRGASATVLCLNCHRQEHTLSFIPGGALGSNIVPTPYTDNDFLPPSEPLYPMPAIEVGDYSGYARQFYGYSTGMEYLNGTHGKYTGNFQQVSEPSRYAGVFSTYEDPEYPGAGVGCTTCHDVHQSTVKAVNASAPFKKDCPDCHTEKASFLMTGMTAVHPDGTGTPLGDGSDIAGACKICHMPRPNQGNGSPSHIFRISLDQDYSTFPTSAQWDAGQKTANTAPDGAYAEAVWLDVDITCGQCHVGDGGSGYSTPRNHATQRTKAELVLFAKGIHGDGPTARFSYSKSDLTVNVDASDTSCAVLPCSLRYQWEWGDGATTPYSSSPTAAHTYAAAGTYRITLTAYDINMMSIGTKALDISVFAADLKPTAAGCESPEWNADTWTASCTDASTDDNGISQVRITWGDGSVSYGSQGGSFAHTYLSIGTRTITHTVYDTTNQSDSETATVTASYFTISGTVKQSNGTTPVSSAVVKAQKVGSSITKTVYTNTSGAFTVTNLGPATYNITVSKAGYNFGSGVGVVHLVATVTLGPNYSGLGIIAVSP